MDWELLFLLLHQVLFSIYTDQHNRLNKSAIPYKNIAFFTCPILAFLYAQVGSYMPGYAITCAGLITTAVLYLPHLVIKSRHSEADVFQKQATSSKLSIPQ